MDADAFASLVVSTCDDDLVGGAAFPARYGHVDGGIYAGEWKGMRKEGLGTYT